MTRRKFKKVSAYSNVNEEILDEIKDLIHEKALVIAEKCIKEMAANLIDEISVDMEIKISQIINDKINKR